MSKKGGVPENLTPFKKGVVTNPNGRPKGSRSISTYLKMIVEGDVDDLPDGELKTQLKKQGFDTVAAALAHKKVSLALNKKIKPETQLRAIESAEDRLEGKATQKTEITGKDGEALAISDVTAYEESLRKLSPEEFKKHRQALLEADAIIQNNNKDN